MNKKLLIALSLISTIAVIADDCNDCSRKCSVDCAQSINLWQPHAISAYSSDDILQKRTFFENESHRQEGYQGFFSMAVEYMQNFGEKCAPSCKNLGARPFWSGTNTMTYGTNNGESNLDAYQFGMGDVKDQGTIQLNVKIQHVAAEPMLYFTRRKDERGFFFSLKAPIGAMSVTTNMTEVVAAPNNLPDYASINYPAPAGRYQTLTEAWQSGQKKEFLLLNGKIADCKLTEIRMADLTGVFGYKAWASERGFLDIGFKVSCPTGNVAQGTYVLEPIFGRAGHWGVGGEVTFHHKLYECKNNDRGIDVWFQGDVMHLFSGRQPDWRTFDLKKNGPGSKYMLIQRYNAANPSNGIGAKVPSDVNPTGYIAGAVTQAANITTLPVRSTFSVEGTAALAFDFYQENWNLMIGGEVWGRSKECLKFNCCDLSLTRSGNLNDYAVLGRQISEDLTYINGGDGNSVGTGYFLNLCQPDATINKSLDRSTASSIGFSNFTQYPGAAPIFYLNSSAIPTGLADARDPNNRIPSDLNEALDVEGASASRAVTARLFGQLGYTFKEHRYTPNLSVIGGAEFTAGCNNNAVSLWSVGLQGSVNF